LVVVFLEIFMFKSFQEYVSQRLPAQCLTDRSIEK